LDHLLSSDSDTTRLTVYDNFSSGHEWHLEQHLSDPRVELIRGDAADFVNVKVGLALLGWPPWVGKGTFLWCGSTRRESVSWAGTASEHPRKQSRSLSRRCSLITDIATAGGLPDSGSAVASYFTPEHHRILAPSNERSREAVAAERVDHRFDVSAGRCHGTDLSPRARDGYP
jgi:hypothetical protein